MSQNWPTAGANKKLITASGLVLAGPAIFLGVAVITGAAASHIDVYDATQASPAAAKLGPFDATATQYSMGAPATGVQMTGGIYVNYSGTATLVLYYV